MVSYAGKENGNEIYEGFEIGDFTMTLHGVEEETEFGEDYISTYFHVVKAIAEVEVDNQVYYAAMSEEFVKDLNDFKKGFYLNIIEQINEW